MSELPPEATPEAMADLARALWGEPNRTQSTKYELRFGTNGSKSVDLRKMTFFDHEANVGGVFMDLCKLAGLDPERRRNGDGRDHPADGFRIPSGMLSDLGRP